MPASLKNSQRFIMNLVPAWATHYDEFWKTLRARNLWFIKLRFGAAFMLAAFIISAEFYLGLTFTTEQQTALIILTGSILLYNLVIIFVRSFVKPTPDSFNPIHLALIMIVLDLGALILLCYYTGTIESPLFMLFLFHMIIGSLILPGKIMYATALTTIFLFASVSYLEYFGIVQHHGISGLLHDHLYTNFTFISAVLTIFAFVVLMTVVITNRIARELYMMEQKLYESLKKIEAAEIEKQKHIMGVVHEIKTPLTAVHSYLDVILQKFLGPLDFKVEERLQRAKTRSSEAIDLINDVLRISNIKLQDDLNLEEINIKDLLCNIADRQQGSLQKKNISIEISDYRSPAASILADKFLLEIALSNLISNAVKYTPPGGQVKAEISSVADQVIIDVSDSGIGIPETDLPRIFNDFYRASNIKNKNFEGTGLGLTIVRQIIERHSGSVTAVSPSKIGSTINPGTTFTVILPEYKKSGKEPSN